MDAPLACWRCEQPGHGYADCQRPPAKTRQELDQRINQIIIRWDAGNGGFSRSVKNKLVEIERTARRNYEKARNAA